MSDVTILAPSPTLTVTVEDHPQGSEIHVHAGGQGVWQARMLRRLQVPVRMCCLLTGEVGRALRHLLEDEDITVHALTRDGRGSAYVHDRRGGERIVIDEERGDPIGRHDLDDLYSAMLSSSEDSQVVVLSGPAGEETIPADFYRRLTIDLRAAGKTVVADLSGERLRAVVEGGVDVLKVSHEELKADGLVAAATDDEIIAAMQRLRTDGAGAVIVTRAADPLLFMDGDRVIAVSPPPFEENETRGAGDSLTAGVIAGLVRGEPLRDAITLGAAAGALNVTRHGLGTGDADLIGSLRTKVTVRDMPPRDAEGREQEGRVSPDGLAALADPEEDS
ncbi:PfkB family carbohydrate kinase [Microbacterium aerolatum]|uniref:1-phosphofructokinase family hexose kinase n=1 Tax=Microbacterium aerolatum TaxID=153731 RepID=UPI002000DD08|nr:PfkB family carbohydrate kinase [Microbacterium aerolatum]MCK3770952.1 PfkB family carbohydrate kinase [Microbacterium aerolatum]